MGGASSRFGETAWDQVHGGLKDKSETIDKSPPTVAHTILALRRPNIVNQRLFDVCNDLEELLYKSQPVEGTTKDFDLLTKDGKPLFRIHPTDSSHSQWIVFVYEPVWNGQIADNSLAEHAGEISHLPQYRKARIDIAWDKHVGEVMLYGPSNEDGRGDVVMTPGTGPDTNVPTTVGEVDGVDYGAAAPSPKVILKVEEIKSLTAQYQSFVPTPLTPNLDAVVHPPLVGYWVWEHSPNRHQIKMHLGRGTDVALHCLLAIITNQVYVERKAEE